MKPTGENLAAFAMTLSQCLHIKKRHVGAMKGIYCMVLQAWEIARTTPALRAEIPDDMEAPGWQAFMAITLAELTAEPLEVVDKAKHSKRLCRYVCDAMHELRQHAAPADKMARVVLGDLYDSGKRMLEEPDDPFPAFGRN
jgi:hypothetical protein